MDKRIALAISSDDMAPEVAETCFANLGPVDENSDDDSGNEGPATEKPPAQVPPPSAGQ
jgi:hypothetical protein